MLEDFVQVDFYYIYFYTCIYLCLHLHIYIYIYICRYVSVVVPLFVARAESTLDAGCLLPGSLAGVLDLVWRCIDLFGLSTQEVRQNFVCEP